ncbi:MAG: efflux RND transporter permease subunit [Acidobacteriota bacterium]
MSTHDDDAPRVSGEETLPGVETTAREPVDLEPEDPGEDDRGSRLSSFTTSRPVAVLMVFIALAVFGFMSYGRLPVTLMPELTYPTLTVRTTYPGAAPEEVENDISRPIEEALGVIGGLRRISSISRSGVSDVVMEFSWDTEISDATQDALERLDLVFLPDEAERPLILHYDPSLDPVMELSLSGAGGRFADEEGLRRLRRLADLQIKRALEPVTGVAAVRVRGGLEEEIHVLIDEKKLSRTGLSIQTVINRLSQENINVAGGTIKEGRTEYMVRTLNEYEDIGQIENTVVARLAGRDVRLRDLGTVQWSHKEREIETRTDGGESVQIDIFKEADANIVALAKRVRLRLGEIDEEAAAGASASERGGPGGRQQAAGLAQQLFVNEGAKLQVVADRSLFIESSINEVRNTAIIGGILAILVLFVFLRNVKTTLIVAVSIPVSLLITFGPLKVLGVSLNIMSLGGLALGIGMLVDSSIVVLESIFRCREEGDDVVPAAVRGTGEVRAAVIASTLTSIAVFFPMVFVEGIAGEAFGDLGLAVVISLLASLLVAVFLIPMLASRQGIRQGRELSDGVFSSFETWGACRRDFAAYRGRFGQGGVLARLGRIVSLPLVLLYFLLRLVLGSVFELVAKLLIGGGLLFGVLLRRVLLPFLGIVFKVLMFLPSKITEGALGFLRNTYPPVLRWAIRHTGTVALVALLLIAGSVAIALELDNELLPEVHQGEFTFEVALPVGTPIQETNRILEPVEQAILAERDSIEALILTVGFDAANSQRSDEGEHTARFKVLLDRPQIGFGQKVAWFLSGRLWRETDLRAREEAVIARIRQSLAEVPDLDARVVRPVLFSSKTPIEVEVHGDNLAELKRQGEEVRAMMASLPELTDVEVTLKSGAPEVQIVYDRELLLRYGLNLRGTAELVRNQVKGFEATRFNLQDRRVPILVRLGEDDRESVEDLRALVVNPSGSRPIPLASIADVSLGEGPSEVRRVDGRRVALVNANIGEGSLGGAVAAIENALTHKVDWPSDMTYYIAGQNEEWQRSRGSLYLALALSIFLVYVIMAAQFESLVQPLVIMFTIPLAFLGTVLALQILGISLSIVVVLGMIMLAGIVVNNAIVLVDYINTLRGRGLSRDAAIVTAGEARLRPILMTTATTVLGLLPMALGVGDGAEIRTPMAIAVISGLVVSTALTLLIVPAVYALFDRIQSRLLGREEATEEAAGGLYSEPETALT